MTEVLDVEVSAKQVINDIACSFVRSETENIVDIDRYIDIVSFVNVYARICFEGYKTIRGDTISSEPV